jgi:hypothetical protein
MTSVPPDVSEPDTLAERVPLDTAVAIAEFRSPTVLVEVAVKENVFPVEVSWMVVTDPAVRGVVLVRDVCAEL